MLTVSKHSNKWCNHWYNHWWFTSNMCVAKNGPLWLKHFAFAHHVCIFTVTLRIFFLTIIEFQQLCMKWNPVLLKNVLSCNSFILKDLMINIIIIPILRKLPIPSTVKKLLKLFFSWLQYFKAVLSLTFSIN